MITDGDLARALLLLPSPLFRQRDVYDVAIELGLKPWHGQAIWMRLVQRGLIVRTATPIARGSRRFYWERTPNGGLP